MDATKNERMIGTSLAHRAQEFVASEDPARVADLLIGGITRADLSEAEGLLWESTDPNHMLIPPLPNFMFQRDPSCWIFGGVTLNPMAKPARKPETMIVETQWRSHKIIDYLDASGGLPDDEAARSALVRVIEGFGPVEVTFSPRPDFGRNVTELELIPGGVAMIGGTDPIVLMAEGIEARIAAADVDAEAIAAATRAELLQIQGDRKSVV